jgi:hypothetical protein
MPHNVTLLTSLPSVQSRDKVTQVKLAVKICGGCWTGVYPTRIQQFNNSTTNSYDFAEWLLNLLGEKPVVAAFSSSKENLEYGRSTERFCTCCSTDRFLDVKPSVDASKTLAL